MLLSQKPLAFVDVETSGLDPVENEILEFAAVSGDDVLEIKIKPRRIHTATPRALEVNGYNAKDWEDAEDISVAAPKIIAFLRGSVIAGQNVGFDVDFIEAFLLEAGIFEVLDYHHVDICAISYLMLVPYGLESLSLAHVCEFLGIPPEPKIHRALNGALLARKVYERFASGVTHCKKQITDEI